MNLRNWPQIDLKMNKIKSNYVIAKNYLISKKFVEDKLAKSDHTFFVEKTCLSLIKNFKLFERYF